jgi:outer membrane protein OmpA-like peptidoglycan-associated protein
MCRFGVLTAAALLALGLGSSAGLAQAPIGTSEATNGKVLDIQGKVLDIVGLGADAQGSSSRIGGQVVSLGAAIQDLKGAGSGVVVTETPRPPAPGPKTPPRREVKIYLPADVLFDFDKADLRPEAAPVLERVAGVLRSDPTSSAIVEGHTDGMGNDQYNQALSERRAQSVGAPVARLPRGVQQHGGTRLRQDQAGRAQHAAEWGRQPRRSSEKPAGGNYVHNNLVAAVGTI